MTNEQLDALVAEKVMGWTFYRQRLHPNHTFLTQTWRTEHGSIMPSMWTPTTEIAQAWEVVERMVKLGWNVRIMNYGIAPELPDCEPWRCDFIRVGALSIKAASALPLAICLAALKAVGVEVEE